MVLNTYCTFRWGTKLNAGVTSLNTSVNSVDTTDRKMNTYYASRRPLHLVYSLCFVGKRLQSVGRQGLPHLVLYTIFIKCMDINSSKQLRLIVYSRESCICLELSLNLNRSNIQRSGPTISVRFTTIADKLHYQPPVSSIERSRTQISRHKT